MPFHQAAPETAVTLFIGSDGFTNWVPARFLENVHILQLPYGRTVLDITQCWSISDELRSLPCETARGDYCRLVDYANDLGRMGA